MINQLGQAYQAARVQLRAALAGDDFATPDLDARLLAAAAFGVPASFVLLYPEHVVTEVDFACFNRLVERRGKGEPVARILEKKEFWGLDLTLSPETLIPRPETEGMVEAVLAHLGAQERQQESLRLLDIGTGSGAILIALLSELPNACGVAVDISEGALRTACDNAKRHHVGARFLPVLSDYAAALDGLFDVIVANPPYIGLCERADLPVEVREHDPATALFAGEDGLEAYRLLLPFVAGHLQRRGICVLEHGSRQSEPVTRLAEQFGLMCNECIFDMAGLPRFVKIVKN